MIQIPGYTDEDIRVLSIFLPHIAEKTFKAISENQQFVHYCDSGAALSMIQHKKVWMRNTTWMNDESELHHGRDLLVAAYSNSDGLKLRSLLDGEWPGFCADFERVFNSWINIWQNETYITCLTEKLEKEDTIGRLSMWRAYGPTQAPVAFVVDGAPFLRPSDALNAYSSPVAYLDETDFNEHFKRIVEGIASNFEFLKSFGQIAIFNHLFAAFRFAIICTKHPSFYEEREWRIIHQPHYEDSKRLEQDIVTINGAPQQIFKIPMQNVPEEGLYGVTLPELLVRIIIGPTRDAENLQREFIRILTNENVPNAASKVVVSNVPLRK